MSGPLTALAIQVLRNAIILDNYVESNKLNPPSFSPEAPESWDLTNQDTEPARIALAQASHDLYELALGPMELVLMRATATKWDVIVTKVLADNNVYAAVPLEGTATFEEVSTKTGLNLDLTKRLIRYATTIRVFRESEPGRVAHTAQSALQLRNHVSYRREVFFNDLDLQTAFALPQAIKKYPRFGGDDTGATGAVQIALRSEEDIAYFDWLSKDKAKLEDFHVVMSSLQQLVMGEGIVKADIWRDLPPGALVVDIGGSTGHNSIILAKEYPHLNFVVEDLPEVVSENEKKFKQTPESETPAEVKNRVSFLAHNFFEPQPLAADVYLLRYILHDWSDVNCSAILKNLIPKLKSNSRIIIVDVLLNWTENIPLVRAKVQRAMDLDMLAGLGAKERSLEDWNRLFSSVDSRLEIEKTWAPRGTMYNMTLLILKLAV
ncbi:hypothetical protein G7Z17_g1253 [Cylindrodendrum hubeiense]|uniref:O-methyltransferase C-terminal domain-containing protein n=1 Tax=Cylindrodendrum hubeiense TaxID=595255 RepID=A0A9P5LFK5_9HYPO|nr:hypothetical protein G7Z17_g1253 [Cylindrodendrum hubeiense]